MAIEIHDNLDAIEQEWRRFEGVADCTVFQTFDWLASWQRQVGRRAGVRPAIVLGRRADGELMFLMPLSVTAGSVRRLTWLGCELCDYNTPVLAPDFAAQIAAEDFRALWREICGRLKNSPQHRFDLIDLSKMPETVGERPIRCSRCRCD